VTEEDIRTAAIHLFTTRYLLGIMEGSEFDSIPYSVVECPEHLAKAHQASLESCVLLKNDGLLPLDAKKIKTLAVIGPNANSRHALIGNYYGTSSRYVTVLEGLQDALGEDVRVLYSEGCHLFRDVTRGQVMKDNLISEAVTVTEEADAAVVVVGLDETLEGEQGDTGNSDASGDKLNLLLPASQRRMLDAVLKVGKPTVIVLMAGSAIDLGDAADQADAVLLAWYPGARGGRAVAELLLGKASPSGKLPVTFYHNSQLDEMPAFTDYAMQGRTYRYFPGEPVYPFGYGLTYGDVAVTAAEAVREGDVIRVRAVARNASEVPTDEVVQVYCQNEGSGNAPLNPRLVGFRRIHCPANAEAAVDIAVPAAALRVVDETGSRIDEGQCVFFVGVGQPDSRTQALTGHASVRVAL
ncbi:MAG: glycoside hydrolase family 3 C-terminal domain-containing protein, partial [Aristaeellaceae bacterium]